MKELKEQQIFEYMEEVDRFVLFLHTPLCGTCNKAEQMLIPLEKWYGEIPFVTANVNLTPVFVKDEKVKSVPCLKVVKNGKVRETIYAFHSIPSLVKRIHPILHGGDQ